MNHGNSSETVGGWGVWPVAYSPVTFRPEALRGADGARSATIDYQLTRRHLLAELKRGRLGRVDVCDAHTELLRAAANVGELTEVDCPVCEEQKLINVSYVFGGRLPSFGRCITKPSELTAFNRQQGEYACYVVEICVGCRWNHLLRVFRLGRGVASA